MATAPYSFQRDFPTGKSRRLKPGHVSLTYLLRGLRSGHRPFSTLLPSKTYSAENSPNIRSCGGWPLMKENVFSQLSSLPEYSLPRETGKNPPTRPHGGGGEGIFHLSSFLNTRNRAIYHQAPTTSLPCTPTWHDRQNSERGIKPTLKVSLQRELFHVGQDPQLGR